MNKISHLRHKIYAQYSSSDFVSAAETGEALLREHLANPNEKTLSYADDLFNLACIYDTLGQWERAVFLYYESAREVVAMEGESLDFAYRLSNLGALLCTRGFPDNAYHLFQHVTRILRGGLKADDPVLADGLYNMACAAADTGKMDEALTLHGEALSIRQATGEPADIINSLRGMASIYVKIGDADNAGKFTMGFVKLKAAAGEDTLADMLSLFGTYLNESRHDLALELLVYMLMRFNIKDARLMPAVTGALFKKGKDKTAQLLTEIDALNDRGALLPIIERWEEWEKEGTAND